MSDEGTIDPVASGARYTVIFVNEREPATIDDFLSAAIVDITIASTHQQVTIRGSARHDGEAVVVYEKGKDGTGKDMRTWRIDRGVGGFEARELSAY
ncbi:MAG: hypothetical protein JWM12_2791 [Ilumatobacteraceae bacterium]|nr:hypothetical protein [Ilumatobacteraceae bacterium]